MTSFTPRRPRRVSLRRNPVQIGSASEAPISRPGTSRRPSALTPMAMMTATATVRGQPATGPRAIPNAAAPDLEGGGVDPGAGPVTLQGPIQERLHPATGLLAEPGHLALGDAGHPHGLDQVVDRARGDALDAGLPRITAVSAFPAVRRGSRTPGTQLPFRSRGMRRSTVPARVSQSRSRQPSRRARRVGSSPPWPAPARSPTSGSISRSAAKPIISRKRPASGVFSTTSRRFTISSVIAGLSGLGWASQPDPADIPPVTALSQNLHHPQGHHPQRRWARHRDPRGCARRPASGGGSRRLRQAAGPGEGGELRPLASHGHSGQWRDHAPCP